MVEGKLKEALKDMFAGFGINDRDKFDMYSKYLALSGINVDILTKRIIYLSMSWKPTYGNKMPSLPEIIGNDAKNDEQSELENKWMEFKTTCCNNYKYEPIADWVFTIKKQIGIAEVEDRTDETEKWIKKEFLRIYPSVKSGGIATIAEPVEYQKIGGTVVAVPRIDDGGMLKIGEISGGE